MLRLDFLHNLMDKISDNASYCNRVLAFWSVYYVAHHEERNLDDFCMKATTRFSVKNRKENSKFFSRKMNLQHFAHKNNLQT